jgi:hypothetical protein
VNEGVIVSRIEIQSSTGNAIVSEIIPNFTVEGIVYQANDFSSQAVGVIRSPFNRDISNLRVSAVVYDDANNIIGGGFTYANFIPANSFRGIEVPIVNLPNVGRVEIYPTLSGLSTLTSANAVSEGVSPLVLLRQGFGQNEHEFAFGLVLQNPNTTHSIERSQYNITAYSGDGRLLGVEEGYIELVLPGQTLGIAGNTFLADGDITARMDVQIQTGEYVPSDLLPIFTAENIAYQQGDFSSSLTGQIVNPYPRDISNLRVSAILYDSAANIIGGGYTYLDFVPSSGKAAVEVSVTSSTPPTGAELFASVSGLSDIK